jgi:uncharacterized radical SAM superfamily Fe-S cluster-containing enzyme
MTLERQTASLCGVCYKEIPATVQVDSAGAKIHRRCAQHGDQTGLLEKDPVFYTWIKGQNCPSIYPGLMLDVTRRCNLRCKFCFYNLEKKDPADVYSIGNLVDECAAHRNLAPFILTGGEPTIRPDLPDLIKELLPLGPVEVVTNGVKLAEPEYFESLVPLLSNQVGDRWVANINLSIHDQETDAWKAVLERCRKDKIVLESALIVIDSGERFAQALDICRDASDVVQAFRIKAASQLWNEKKPPTGHGKIFVSDMLSWLEAMDGGVTWKLVPQRQNKSVFVNVAWRGLFLMLVSWHDIGNVDLLDISCPPYYRARNGVLANFVTAALINEGLQKGWMGGRKLT